MTCYQPLTRADLLSLEAYAEQRAAFRLRAIAHKRQRSVALGEHMTLLFEDRLTVQYQIQEMLRIERIFEPAAIQEELDTYNPLISDRTSLKATLLIEFPDPALRALRLAEWRGIEDRLYFQVGNGSRHYAIADADMDRSNATKTSAVHFLDFAVNEDLLGALRAGDPVHLGVDDARYPQQVMLTAEQCRQLAPA
jgi:hypothetical protein